MHEIISLNFILINIYELYCRSQYYTILMSLCVSDIISAFASIFYLYGRTWGFAYFHWPEFFCRVSIFL